jgi:hypothetical protein
MKPHPSFLPLSLLVVAASSTAGCAAADDVGGCWIAKEEGRTVSFFVDTDDDGIEGLERLGEARVIGYRGTWERTDAATYRIDGSCERVDGDTGVTCDAVRPWSMRCELGEDGEELTCVGSPFSAATTLTTCPASGAAP